MRPAVLLGRACLRQGLCSIPRTATPIIPCAATSTTTTSASSARAFFSRSSASVARFPKPRTQWSKGSFAFVAGAALSSLSFVDLSEQKDESKKNGGDDVAAEDDKTSEELMLDASRQELKEQIPRRLKNSKKLRKGIYFFLNAYVWEPICTGVRFVHLFVLFMPVIVSVPAVWVGKRLPECDNERSGTIWWYKYLVWSLERAGASFIKLGQWAASRSDIFPTELCKYLSTLHSNAPAHALSQTKKILERAFDGRPFEDIFQEFDEIPLGVGAIAQVYKAKLHPDLIVPGNGDVEEPKNFRQMIKKGVDVTLKSTPLRVPSDHVAVKVLHPGIDKVVQRDLKIMAFVAAILNVIPTMEWLSFPDEVEQFGFMMKLQLDLRIEAANLTVFRKHFKNRTTAWFPFPYTEYTTREVLVEEFATGIPLADFLNNGGGVFQKDIADEGLDAFLHMLLIDNFIHADLHPGNIMVRFYKPELLDVPTFKRKLAKPQDSPDVTEEVLARLRPHKGQPDKWKDQLKLIDDEGYRPQLIFIDTGLVTELNSVNRTNFLDLFKAVAEFDGYKAGHLMVERCRQPEAALDKEVFALRMQHLVLGVKSRTFALGNVKIGDILNEVLNMVRNHHVRLEGDFVNVVLSILLLEGIGRQLNPSLDLFEGALPILRKLGAQGGSSMINGGDFSMLKVWVGLEARSLLQASTKSVEMCVKYDLLSPNI